MQAINTDDARIDDVGIKHSLWQRLKRMGCNTIGDVAGVNLDELDADDRQEIQNVIMRIVRRLKERGAESKAVAGSLNSSSSAG